MEKPDMRGLLSASAIALVAAFAAPASAQMCGGGQMTVQAQGQSGGMGMCGMGVAAAPVAGQQAQTQQSGMCGCCQRMAMMQAPAGGQGTTGSQAPMDRPAQDATPGMQMMPSQG